MKRSRLTALAALAAAGLAATGVAAAVRHVQTTQSAAADLSATTVSQSRTTTCTASDGTYRDTVATYRGSSTSSDARLNGTLEIRSHSVVNTTTGLGWLEGTLRIRGTNAGASGTIHAAIAGGAAVGSVVGAGSRPAGKLVASFSSPFTPGGGFSSGKLGSGSANGAGVLFSQGDCRRTKRVVSTAVFHLGMTPRQVVPPVKMNAEGTGNLTLDLSRDASGNVTGGTVVFYVNYRFPGAVTITGLALHQGARGANGPVVLDAATGSISDSDGRGNVTKVVGGASAALLQALLANPRGYYVELTTSATTTGALRDQLASPTRQQ